MQIECVKGEVCKESAIRKAETGAENLTVSSVDEVYIPYIVYRFLIKKKDDNGFCTCDCAVSRVTGQVEDADLPLPMEETEVGDGHILEPSVPFDELGHIAYFSYIDRYIKKEKRIRAAGIRILSCGSLYRRYIIITGKNSDRGSVTFIYDDRGDECSISETLLKKDKI